LRAEAPGQNTLRTTVLTVANSLNSWTATYAASRRHCLAIFPPRKCDNYEKRQFFIMQLIGLYLVFLSVVDLFYFGGLFCLDPPAISYLGAQFGFHPALGAH
jgi:hypothetical protein